MIIKRLVVIEHGNNSGNDSSHSNDNSNSDNNSNGNRTSTTAPGSSRGTIHT